VAPLGIVNGTLGCRGTPVGNHWPRASRSNRGLRKLWYAWSQWPVYYHL